MSDPFSSSVVDDEDGERLDRWLARHLEKPRNQVHRWISDGYAAINGRGVKPSTSVRAGDVVTCTPPAPPSSVAIKAERGNLSVLFEDDDLAVIDKAAGIAVHPGAGRDQGTLAHFLLHRYPEISHVGGARRPGIVHRLDLDTTGVLVVARSELAYQNLSTAFADRRVEKTYLAIVYGTPRQSTGSIDLPIGRHRHQRKQMQVRNDGRPAVTHYRVDASRQGISRLELDLETGRTHQIRVHLKAIRHPLVGDPVYGEARWRALPSLVRRPLRTFARPALHAWRLAFEHPRTGTRLTVEAPLPQDMHNLWLEVTRTSWDPTTGSTPAIDGPAST